ncbi:MAG: 50S ribosomal protein L3 [Patescibacteria group bacterium]|nr:50S ribosomal protein L3 [Patescibacteria group bacterium]
MAGFILGIKEGQSQVFNQKGERVPVTYIKADDCYLIGIKTKEKNGYFSVKLGIKKTKRIKKPIKGELKKASIQILLRFLKEIRLDKNGREAKFKVIEEGEKRGIINDSGTKVFIGDKLKPNFFFKKGEKVVVSGTSKGKGFQGVFKRYGFAGGPRTHGQSQHERAPGSVGMTTTPGRIFKGKRMAGRMGNERVTIKGLEVIDVSDDHLMIKGFVPGVCGGLLEVVSDLRND